LDSTVGAEDRVGSKDAYEEDGGTSEGPDSIEVKEGPAIVVTLEKSMTDGR
jgi:hypothetical protein